MEAGTMALTRLSTAAVSQVVQPRLEPPITRKSRIDLPRSARKIWMVSIARTAALVIARCTAHSGSPVSSALSRL